jgi:glycosyltransferase involved in cell wall biosynthesis
MKIALIHDQLVDYGGAETLFLTLARMYPEADIFTSYFDEKNRVYDVIKQRIVQFSHLPLRTRFSTFGKLFINAYWQSLDLSDYGLVVTSSDSLSCHSVVTSPRSLHVAYIHTSPKYLYAEHPNYYSMGSSSWFRKIIISYLRLSDQIASVRPDLIIVPSTEVKHRIKKYYRRDSVVIPGPVPEPLCPVKKSHPEYYLVFSRIENHKGIELILQTFSKIKKKLLIVGTGREYKRLKNEYRACKSITFLGWIPEEDKYSIFMKAKALINASRDEDLGLTVIEALKHGVPVIAYSSGSMREIVKDGINGFHFDDFTSNSLLSALVKIEKESLDWKKIIKSSKKFSEKKFVYDFSKLVTKQLGLL